MDPVTQEVVRYRLTAVADEMETSLLRAGLVPRLRGEAFCPVYVRVDYAAESPPPAAQIKQAIFRTTAAAGHWTRPGTAVAGESLWEFLHHREDLLRDAGGRTVLPLLIFGAYGGVLADRYDKRRLLMATQGLMAIPALTLWAIVVAGSVEAWMVYALVLARGCVTALDNPDEGSVSDVIGAAQDLRSRVRGYV